VVQWYLGEAEEHIDDCGGWYEYEQGRFRLRRAGDGVITGLSTNQGQKERASG